MAVNGNVRPHGRLPLYTDDRLIGTRLKICGIYKQVVFFGYLRNGRHHALKTLCGLENGNVKALAAKFFEKSFANGVVVVEN